MADRKQECRLCGKTGPLIKSHTIPKALHKDVQKYEETGEFIRIYSDQFNYEPTSKSGPWDRIVCNACEKRFQTWDDYGINFVRAYKSGKAGRLLGPRKRPIGFAVDEFDYLNLKTFVMSLLWRANENSQPLFRRINIGKKWRAALSQSVLAGDPGPPEFFAVAASVFKKDVEKHFMADPHPERYQGINHIRFYVYGGFTFLIKVDQRRSPKPFNQVILRDDKPFLIFLRNLSPSEKRLAQRILSR